MLDSKQEGEELKRGGTVMQSNPTYTPQVEEVQVGIVDEADMPF